MWPLGAGAAGRRLARVAATLGGTAALAVAAGCEFDKATVPPGRERLVVHAVLNPFQREQWILVERTLTGRVSIDSTARFDPRDPIVTGEGIPVSGAEVVITHLATGDTAYAPEEVLRSTTGQGRGVYRLLNGPAKRPPLPDDAMVIGRAGQYTLRVRTATGTVTGEVTVPDVTALRPPPTVDTLNVDTDTLTLQWAEGGGASHYALRVESPFGPFFFFTDSLTYRLTGELRNLFAEDLPKVFIPGFQQQVQVAGVDENFFDYYRSTNSPFTGSGIINHLDGGIGLVGAYVPLETRSVFVTGNDDQPIEGTYVPATFSYGFADTLRIFVYDRTRDGLAISGYLRRIDPSDEADRYQLLGTVTGGRFELTGRSVSPFGGGVSRLSAAGTFAGDSIVIEEPVVGPGHVVYYKTSATRQAAAAPR
jgi:hypothetical protein